MAVTTQQGRTFHQFVVLRSLDKGVGVMKILYKQENGRLAIIQPASEALEIMTIDQARIALNLTDEQVDMIWESPLV